jgi:hypothetical protein
MALTAH